MLNINYGHNKVLMEKCRRLKEYAIFVDAVRKGLSSGAPLEESLSHYDKELHDKTLRREGYEDGYNEGLAAAKETGIRQFISTLQELQLSHENVLKKLHEKYELSQEESEIYMKKYWEK